MPVGGQARMDEEACLTAVDAQVNLPATTPFVLITSAGVLAGVESNACCSLRSKCPWVYAT